MNLVWKDACYPSRRMSGPPTPSNLIPLLDLRSPKYERLLHPIPSSTEEEATDRTCSCHPRQKFCFTEGRYCRPVPNTRPENHKKTQKGENYKTITKK
jgi:hypothetical protein